MDSDYCLEIACFDTKSLLHADSAGPDRTEFCANRASGGMTPPLEEILTVLPLLKNLVNIMIRPREGGFIYSPAEFELMKQDICTIKSATASGFASASASARLSGFVFGILDARGRVDVSRNAELVELARPLACTFHRAFDETEDLEKALEDVIACGFGTVLTSGGEVDAVSGVDVLGRLVERAGGRIVVMPGGGVRSSNVGFLMEKTRARWYHSSAVVGDGISIEEVGLIRLALKGTI